MRKLYLFIIPLLGWIVLSSTSCCTNDDNSSTNPIDQLPPATQTGKNTFGFLINGELVAIINTSKMSAIYQGGFIQFGAGGVYLRREDPFVVNTEYSLIGKARYVEDEGQNSCYYDVDDSFEGHVIFTKIDKVNYIVSGTFEFSTVTDNCEPIRITNGRFDMKYTP